MQRYRPRLGLAAALLAGLSMHPDAAAKSLVDTKGASECKARGFSTDTDPKGTNVRSAPRADAPVIGHLSPNALIGPNTYEGVEFVWSGLDCPTGYTVGYDQTTGWSDGVPILLGRLAARIDTCLRPGERSVITTWPTGRDGRKCNAEAAMFGEAGELLAIARATWIIVDRAVQVGEA